MPDTEWKLIKLQLSRATRSGLLDILMPKEELISEVPVMIIVRQFGKSCERQLVFPDREF